jgi:hypothetical protein
MQSKRSKNDPKGSQRAPKVSQNSVIMHPRIALSARVDFGSEKEGKVIYFLSHFSTIFHQKANQKSMLKKMSKKHEKKLQ